MATYKVKSRGVEYTVTVVDKATGGSLVTVDGREFEVNLSDGDTAPAVTSRHAAPAWKKLAMVSEAVLEGDGKIVAPISGTIISLDVEVGDWVSLDQVVLRLEAMKMENDITAPVAGTVKEITTSEGSDVSTGQLLMTIG